MTESRSTEEPHSYREFIDPSQPMYLSDQELLEVLRDRTHVTPHQLAESQYRENVLRLQLRDLERVGCVHKVGHESYLLTPRGRRTVDELEQGEMVEIENFEEGAVLPADWRLNDFSAVDAKVIKNLNRDIKDRQDSTYGHVRQNQPELTEQRISNVTDSDINRLIREFPTNAPLPEACAHWVRAIVGLHLFPDANHRTATNSLEYLVEQSGGPSSRIIHEDIPRYVLHSKYIRAFQSDVRFNTLWAKDELFSLWYRYFTKSLCPGLEDRRPNDPPTEKLDRILEEAREMLNGVDL